MTLPLNGMSLAAEDVALAAGKKPHIVVGCLGELSWLGLSLQVGKKREPSKLSLWRISSRGKQVVEAFAESFGGRI